jgi:hypothetical protein
MRCRHKQPIKGPVEASAPKSLLWNAPATPQEHLIPKCGLWEASKIASAEGVETLDRDLNQLRNAISTMIIEEVYDKQLKDYDSLDSDDEEITSSGDASLKLSLHHSSSVCSHPFEAAGRIEKTVDAELVEEDLDHVEDVVVLPERLYNENSGTAGWLTKKDELTGANDTQWPYLADAAEDVADKAVDLAYENSSLAKFKDEDNDSCTEWRWSKSSSNASSDDISSFASTASQDGKSKDKISDAVPIAQPTGPDHILPSIVIKWTEEGSVGSNAAKECQIVAQIFPFKDSHTLLEPASSLSGAADVIDLNFPVSIKKTETVDQSAPRDFAFVFQASAKKPSTEAIDDQPLPRGSSTQLSNVHEHAKSSNELVAFQAKSRFVPPAPQEKKPSDRTSPKAKQASAPLFSDLITQEIDGRKVPWQEWVLAYNDARGKGCGYVPANTLAYAQAVVDRRAGCRKEYGKLDHAH